MKHPMKRTDVAALHDIVKYSRMRLSWRDLHVQREKVVPVDIDRLPEDGIRKRID